ncbi:MAG: TetR/AcrR family transcriptional regulator [Curvibacter sp.]|jgi:AcrR family transcriptional regulator
MDAIDSSFDYQTARRDGDAAARRGLLDLAHRLLADEGPQALTLRSLAQRANCSTKVVYTLFGGKNGLSQALKVEGFELLRFTVERERRRHRDPVSALLPVMLSYRTFALAHRALFGAMFGNAFPEYVPSDFSRQQARLALGALEEAVASALAARGATHADPHEAALRLWAAVHGPVCLELEGITPFDSEGERLARLGLNDVLASLGLAGSAEQRAPRAPAAASPASRVLPPVHPSKGARP